MPEVTLRRRPVQPPPGRPAGAFAAATLRRDAGAVVGDAAGDRADLRLIDALARAALAARRARRPFIVRNAPPALRRLVELAGLAEAIPCEPPQGDRDRPTL
jgi:STAS domain